VLTGFGVGVGRGCFRANACADCPLKMSPIKPNVRNLILIDVKALPSLGLSTIK
jgi:hypothetical protein